MGKYIVYSSCIFLLYNNNNNNNDNNNNNWRFAPCGMPCIMKGALHRTYCL